MTRKFDKKTMKFLQKTDFDFSPTGKIYFARKEAVKSNLEVNLDAKQAELINKVLGGSQGKLKVDSPKGLWGEVVGKKAGGKRKEAIQAWSALKNAITKAKKNPDVIWKGVEIRWGEDAEKQKAVEKKGEEKAAKKEATKIIGDNDDLVNNASSQPNKQAEENEQQGKPETVKKGLTMDEFIEQLNSLKNIPKKTIDYYSKGGGGHDTMKNASDFDRYKILEALKKTREGNRVNSGSNSALERIE